MGKSENSSKINKVEQDLAFFPLTNDLLFHMVFTKSPQALKSLLSCLLNIPLEEILEVEILNPMQYNEQFDMNLSVLDLKLHLNREKYVLVEMQVRRFAGYPERTLVYTCRQIADQDKGKGFQYADLQPVIQISIMDHTLFPEHKRFFSTYELKDEEDFLYSDKLRIIVMDLTAISEATEEERKQGLVEWAKAFKANNWSSVEEIKNDGVKKAMETMKLIMAEPAERMMLEYRHKTEVDYRSWYGEAQREGEKKGREEEIIKSIHNLMKTTNWSAKQAMDALMLSPLEQSHYESLL